jgi:sugar phosphate isomerase/epimerase
MTATRPIGLAALTVLEVTPLEQIGVAAEAGFSHVGLRLIPATAEEVRHPMIGDTPLVRAILARLADTGIKVLDAEIIRLKPETAVAEYLPAMATAARLGASHLLVAGNDPDERRLIDRFGELCDAAAKFDLTANIEPMPWTYVKDIVQAARILTAAGRANAGVLIDPIHFDRARSRISDIASVPQQWFRYMQLCDAPAERPADTAGVLHQARAERLFPGEGGLDLRGILRALPREIPISLEIPMEKLAQTVGAVERTRRALAATRALLRSLDEEQPLARLNS